jgi:hypothetical protein
MRLFYSPKSLASFLLLLGFLLTTYCSDHSSNIESVATSQPNSNLRPMLVLPEDLGWPTSGYIEVLTPAPLAVNIPAEDAFRIHMTAVPNPVNPRTGVREQTSHVATQAIYAYANENAAIEVFQQVSTDHSIFRLQALPEEIKFEQQVSRIGTGCILLEASYLNCLITLQHGRYVINATMAVDEQVITWQDLELFINLLQDRLITYTAEQPDEEPHS